MDSFSLEWLLDYFSVFGFEFQNWMPIIALIVLTIIVYSYWTDRHHI